MICVIFCPIPILFLLRQRSRQVKNNSFSLKHRTEEFKARLFFPRVGVQKSPRQATESEIYSSYEKDLAVREHKPWQKVLQL